MLEHTLSDEEHNQIVQTIEMFEVIAQTQPDDYQSLEILKEAYQKVGRHDEYLRVSRRLAEAYFNVGSYSIAMQEFEALLVNDPNSPELLAMLGEIEGRLHLSDGAGADPTAPDSGLIAMPSVANEIQLLVEPGGRGSQSPGGHRAAHLQERGDDQLAKFLVVQQLFGEEEVSSALERVKHLNTDVAGQMLSASLLETVCGTDTAKLEAVLSALIDRTKFAYVPLEYYDVDRQISRMLPDHLTLNRLFVPFDLISRTIMIATCNPFDAAGREAVQQSLDYTVSWYLARPSAIVRSLQDIYRLESRAA